MTRGISPDHVTTVSGLIWKEVEDGHAEGDAAWPMLPDLVVVEALFFCHLPERREGKLSEDMLGGGHHMAFPPLVIGVQALSRICVREFMSHLF